MIQHPSPIASSQLLPPLLAFCLCLAVLPAYPAPNPVVLLDHRLHLGTANEPEWDIFANPPQPPHAPEALFSFALTDDQRAAASNRQRPYTLWIRQDDVKETWQVSLNGRRLGRLFPMEAPLVHLLEVPPDSLRSGQNELTLIPPRTVDDVVLHEIKLIPSSLEEICDEAHLEINVIESGNGQPLPCRLTIVDDRGHLAALRTPGRESVASRPGVVYSANGNVRVGLPAGRYRIHATRGFEYGLASTSIALEPGQSRKLDLTLSREVDTSGWISCDPHTHTVTYSRHGDATIEERLVTLAGEGIEMPVATDHNILVDYEPAARETGASSWLTPVIGDEVTTQHAHFNVFPVDPESRVPDFRIGDWSRLLEHLRATPGVEVVILNHPLNVHNAFQPFAPTNMNLVTGEMYRHLAPGFDALELMNSSAQQTDMMDVFEGWFALLNAGHRIVAVGSSDGHDVSRYIVGQGRTYIEGEDTHPNRLDIVAACRQLKAGRALVSMGLLVQMKVNDRYRVGDLASVDSDTVKVEITVQGPSWTAVDHVQLFGNGQLLREARFGPESRQGLKHSQTWTFPRPKHDMHLVALATGPGVTNLYWPIPRPYQRRSPNWTPRVMGATNPIWLNADGDALYSPARDYAVTLTALRGTEPAVIIPELQDYDAAIAAQVASLCARAGHDLDGEEARSALVQASPAVRRGFEDYIATQ